MFYVLFYTFVDLVDFQVNKLNYQAHPTVGPSVGGQLDRNWYQLMCTNFNELSINEDVNFLNERLQKLSCFLLGL